MFKKVFLIFAICALFSPSTIYAADYAFTIGEKHWRVTLSQRALNEFGYKTDRTDGVFTQATATALEAFQRKYNLPLTKNIDKKTYAKLMELHKSNQPISNKSIPASAVLQSSPVTTTATKATTTATRPSAAVIASSKSASKKTSKKPATSSSSKKGNASTSKNLPDKIISTASKYSGVPYKFGGTTHKGFDCSGYTQAVFRQHGLTLPRSADMQYKLGRPISKKELRKGDLVFFSTYEPGPSHVGIYDGNGKFWNATTSRGVMASPLNDPYYWGPRYLGARRIF